MDGHAFIMQPKEATLSVSAKYWQLLKLALLQILGMSYSVTNCMSLNYVFWILITGPSAAGYRHCLLKIPVEGCFIRVAGSWFQKARRIVL
jgi:hypothetical protein